MLLERPPDCHKADGSQILRTFFPLTRTVTCAGVQEVGEVRFVRLRDVRVLRALPDVFWSHSFVQNQGGCSICLPNQIRVSPKKRKGGKVACSPHMIHLHLRVVHTRF